jgi:light-regulated signal transduction histidine kinase (bacteriophytochrome)
MTIPPDSGPAPGPSPGPGQEPDPGRGVVAGPDPGRGVVAGPDPGRGVGPGGDADLAVCDAEPIRVPGGIQPHGVLLAFDEDGLVLSQASENLRELGRGEAASLMGLTLDDALAGDAWTGVRRALLRALEQPLTQPRYLGTVAVPRGATYHALAHRSGPSVVLELERTSGRQEDTNEFYDPVRDAVDRLRATRSVEELCAQAAVEFRRLTGFDRALVYRFDADWNGTVVAEDRTDRLPSYLDLRFPASDIPRQARELYRLNRVRLIPDAGYEPVSVAPALHPRTGAPLDLGFAALRSVSPVHLEYMRNMGTPASMSVSVVVEGELWALISCHHAEPRGVPLPVRLACDFLGQVLSAQVAAGLHAAQAARRAAHQRVQARLLTEMAAADPFIEGLLRAPEDLLSLTGAEGAAVLHRGTCRLVGNTPGEEAVRAVAARLSEIGDDEVFATDSLARHVEGAEAWEDRAAGLLAIGISKLHASYVLWFRPEAVRTVRWGGDPAKRVEEGPGGPRIHPRKSFETWKETVRHRSVPWGEGEVEAARELRNAIVGIVLRKAEELAELNEELERSNKELERSNKELEAFSYSVSHDLRAPFRHIVGYAELLKEHEGGLLTDRGRRYVEVILESTRSAGHLVDSLLAFSRMGRASLVRVEVRMNALVDEARRTLEPDSAGRDIEWRIEPLPEVQGDPAMLRLVWQNLLSNAIKYTRKRERAVIEVGSRPGEHERIFFVRDNGVGFDMAYSHKLFGVFQRLHRIEDFEGIGIGLANVRRIVERHGGRSWADGDLDRGATFSFSLPASTVIG